MFVAGSTIEKLCDYGSKCIEGGMGMSVPRAVHDRASMVRAARCLLAAVTRVLLLADSVVVKQLLLAKDKVCRKNNILITFLIVFVVAYVFVLLCVQTGCV